jgi:hypothetical protein
MVVSIAYMVLFLVLSILDHLGGQTTTLLNTSIFEIGFMLLMVTFPIVSAIEGNKK